MQLVEENGFEVLKCKTFITPFISGYLNFRKVGWFLPSRVRALADKLLLRLPFDKKITSTIFILGRKR